MDILVENLDAKPYQFGRDIAEREWKLVEEVIELADCDRLDSFRSRSIEQEVLDLLDESPSR